jgi:hypothetical protein
LVVGIKHNRFFVAAAALGSLLKVPAASSAAPMQRSPLPARDSVDVISIAVEGEGAVSTLGHLQH